MVLNVLPNIGSIPRRAGIADLIRRAELDKDRPSRFERRDTGELPSAKDRIESRGPLVSKALSIPKRELVNIADNEPVAGVEVRAAAVRFQISGVLRDIAPTRIVDRMTVRVGRKQR